MVNEILRRRDSAPVEGGDPARERVDEAIQVRVRMPITIGTITLELDKREEP